MKKLALMFPLLMMLACEKPPLTTTVTSAGIAQTSCNASNFPLDKGGSSSCCQLGQTEEWHVIDTQQGAGMAHRYLGKACTTLHDVNGQISQPLNFGPCGAAKDPFEDPQLLNGTLTKIFIPSMSSGSNACGYQVMTAGGAKSSPEPYTNQKLYLGVAAGCNFTACLDGTPVVKLTVVTNVSAGILGRVLSNPPGITPSGAGEASGLFPGDVTLIAEPTGKHVRAVFSSGCNKTGEYGERAECLVKLAPDPKVAVTFECEKGFTCGKGKD